MRWVALVACLVFSAEARADAAVGKQAPSFSLKDVNGKEFSLADYKGKKVVIEWFNPDCPFVKYSHTDGPLKDQAASAEDDTVWIAINSGAPGKQGAGAERNKKAIGEYKMNYPVLLDESGKVGKSYGARTTPHVFVVNEKGVLEYAGAIDNAPFGKAKGAKVNYVDKALGNMSAGKPVDPQQTKPYGCSVKYGS
ncbi:MAG: thioredoxin family protein [Myxococcota bacterium]